MKLSNMLSNMKKFYKMIHQDHPHTLFYALIGGFCKALVPFISLYYSSKILDALIESNTQLAISNITLLLVLSFIIGCIDRACYQGLTVISNLSYYSVW